MMRFLESFVLITVLLLANGCKEEQKEQEVNATSLPKLEIKQDRQEKNALKKIGISTEGEKIIIEPKKTKEFLETIAKSLQKEAKKIKKEDLGITKEKDKITIDLNKTQKVLKSFTKELESVAKSLEKVITEEMKYNSQNKGVLTFHHSNMQTKFSLNLKIFQNAIKSNRKISFL